MGTSLSPRPGRPRRQGSRILSWLVRGLALCALVAAPLAQQKKTPAKPAAGTSGKARSALTIWNRVTGALLAEYFVRYPDQAFQRGWPEARTLRLGTFGTDAALRWRDALTDARAGLDRLAAAALPRKEGAQLEAFEAWLEAELLLLDGQALATTDPSGYVQRALRVLQAAAEATWLPRDEREAKLGALLRELPAYFDDAQVSLIAPRPPWIDLALRDLDDLAGLAGEIAATLPAPAKPRTGPAGNRPKPAGEEDPLEAIEAFRRWLLEVRPGAGGAPTRLERDVWARLVRLASGCDLELGEIKARCLRDLASIEPFDGAPGATDILRTIDAGGVVQHASGASARALEVGREAHILRFPLQAAAVEFAVEESPRTRPEIVWLRAGTAGSIRAFVELPSRTWTARMTTTRLEELDPRRQVALGLRHGMAGEALFAHAARTCKRPTAAFLCNRAGYGAVGLFALEWVPGVDWVENPFREDEELLRELERLRGYEGARLLAALELHAEAVSLDEAVLAFTRRTRVDGDTALAEVLQSHRDPLHGIGYLGLLELRELRLRMTELADERKGLQHTLASVLRYPELRPGDLGELLLGAPDRRR